LSETETGLVTVVLNNRGGGLFDSLPTAANAPSYERLFVAPPGRRPADLAAFHSIDHHLVDSSDDLRTAVDQGLEAGRRVLIEVRVDRATDLASRRRLDEAARSALQP